MDFAEIANKIGFDWKLLVFNLINFFVILFLINKFFLRKVLATAAQRQADIEAGYNQKEESEELIKKAALDRQEIINKAKMESNLIIQKADEQAVKLKHAIIVEAQEEAESVKEKGLQSIEMERSKMQNELRTQAKDLVVMATEKLIKEKVSGQEVEEKVAKLILPIK